MSGGLAATTEYLTFLVLHKLGLWLFLANALSFLCGLVVSFLLNKHWVFSHKGNASRQFAMYGTLAALNLAISSVTIVVLVQEVGLPAFIAKLCVMAMIASWNFIIFQRIIFKKTALS
jgi:putative flippase GtrA